MVKVIFRPLHKDYSDNLIVEYLANPTDADINLRACALGWQVVSVERNQEAN